MSHPVSLAPGSTSLAPPLAISRGLGTALAALGPVAIGAILATQAGTLTPLAAAPAIVFGVVAATSPALYIGIAATGDAPPLARVARAFVVALGALGVALAGLVLPAAFLALSSLSPITTIAVTSGALVGAAMLALRRLAVELGGASMSSSLVFMVWSAATIGIAGRLWFDLAKEVTS